jgi:hypothetical protein
VKGGFTFGVFKEMVTDIAVQFRKQDGRFYALLSLDEAEHFRGLLHATRGSPLVVGEKAVTPTSAALWMLVDYEMVLLESSTNFCGAKGSHHGAMVNSYRFLNSDTYFTNPSLTILLRILEQDPCEMREKWWNVVRACRRRRQVVLDGSVPISTVFTTKDEYEYMEYKAIVKRVQHGLQEKGMLIFDAFRAFNSSHSGFLSCSELYGGMEYLGITFTPPQIYDLVRKVAVQAEVGRFDIVISCGLMRLLIVFLLQGLISYEDFKRVFQSPEDDMESRTVGVGESNFESVPPKNIPELVDIQKVCGLSIVDAPSV